MEEHEAAREKERAYREAVARLQELREAEEKRAREAREARRAAHLGNAARPGPKWARPGPKWSAPPGIVKPEAGGRFGALCWDARAQRLAHVGSFDTQEEAMQAVARAEAAARAVPGVVLTLERSDIASGFKGVYSTGAGRFYASACRMKLGVFETAEEVCTRPRIHRPACDVALSFECRRRRLRYSRDFGMGITATPPPHAPLGPPARTARRPTASTTTAARGPPWSAGRATRGTAERDHRRVRRRASST